MFLGADATAKTAIVMNVSVQLLKSKQTCFYWVESSWL